MDDLRCPRCKEEINGYPAISRRDDETLICEICGISESMEDMGYASYDGEPYWKGKKNVL
jgi:hypothetical protein